MQATTIKPPTPELENGAVMTREEFHALYSRCEGLERVELIEGVVYLPSPIKARGHSRPQNLMLFWLNAYAAGRPELEPLGPTTVLLDDGNEPEPDALLLRATPGWESEDGYVAKAPELVVEIAFSSHSRDLNQKMRAYERNGVKEYIVWRTDDKAIDWFELRDGAYVAREPDAAGLIESREFPGLVMDRAAMLENDRERVLAALQTE
jgi:Uma2 family endonuclease